MPSLQMNVVACLSSEECHNTPGLLQGNQNLLKLFENAKRKCHIKPFIALENIYSKKNSQLLHAQRLAHNKTSAKGIDSF